MKLFIASICFALCISNSFGKGLEIGDHRDRLLIGAKIGSNYSNVYDEQGQDFVADPKFGLAFGAFAAIPIGKLFGIQPEFLLSRKGFKANGSLLGSSYQLTRTTTYIDVPIMFQLKPVSFITLMAGPQYSYLVKQNDVFKNSLTSFAQEQEFKNDNVRKNIMSLICGADFGINQVLIGVRLAWDIQANNGDGSSSTPRYKNIWYQATFGYRFL
jgi:hypothetical protein